MSKGKIIFLNGVSSSGKSTIAKTLQEQLTEPYCWLSVDNFITTIHEKFLNAENIVSIFKAVSAMHGSIKVFSDVGLNVIVDHVLERQELLDECVKILHEYPVLFVHVTCPIEELRRREKERGDRGIGQGESQLSRLCPKDTYDITLDTHNTSKEDCANKIIELLEHPEKHTAFKTLWSQRTE
jgi:chloramphenicol 3-O phosphotransferase